MTRWRSAERRRMSVALAVITLASGLLPAAARTASAASADCPGVSRLPGSGWSRIHLPAWPAPDGNRQQASLFVEPAAHVAEDPAHPTHLYATDGVAVLRSSDGGCSWTSIFSLALDAAHESPALSDLPWLDPDYEVSSITVADRHGGAPYLYLTLTVDGNSAELTLGAQPAWAYVATSADDGRTWQTTLPRPAGPAGMATTQNELPAVLRAAPTDPRTAYVGTTGVGSGLFYVTHDGGATWQTAAGAGLPTVFFGDLVDGPNGGDVDWADFTVDPCDARTVWAFFYDYYGTPRTAQVYRSTDAGASFRRVFSGPSSSQDTYDPPFVTFWTSHVGTAVLARGLTVAATSTGSGKRWTPVRMPPESASGHPAVLLGAAQLGGGRVLGLIARVHGQDLVPYQPPTALYVYSPTSRRWSPLAGGNLPASSIGYGGMNVLQPTSVQQPVTAFWFGFVPGYRFGANDANYLWLRWSHVL